MAKKVIHVPSCHSTNPLAEQVLEGGLGFEGTVIIADDQTEGKGQRDNIWNSEAGKNLTFSVILKPTFLSPEMQFYLNIIASLAIKKSIDKLSTKEAVRVKWPNDVMIGSKKVSGILIKNILHDRKIKATIMGMGINVNQINFPHDTAVSLKQIVNKNFDLPVLFEDILMSLEFYYLYLKQGKFQFLKTNYINSMFWLNEWHQFEGEKKFEGKITGIDDKGFLKVETNDQDLLFKSLSIKYCL